MIERLPQAVKAAKIFAATNDLRYYLNGVALYIVDSGVIESVVATDGHCMAIIGNETLPRVTPAIVANKDVDTLVNALSVNPYAIVDGFTLIVGEYRIPLVDGRFPDVQRVIPKKERNAGAVIGIQPNYLAKLKPFKAELCRHLKAKERNFVGVRMCCGDANEAVRFDFTGGRTDNAMVIINPMRL
ncbi:hypothetical protein 13VV501A_gene0044 [Vibrio phage 13VV501A]|nr:hypothetical protein 13VV501A_gene0044 [Vibrio phage 13VV501A]